MPSTVLEPGNDAPLAEAKGAHLVLLHPFPAIQEQVVANVYGAAASGD